MKSVDEVIKSDKYYRALYQKIAQKIWKYRPENVLIMGCHAGWDTEYLLKNTPVRNITMAEPVDSFYNDYKEHFKDNSNVFVTQGKWEELIHFDSKADMVLCFDCIEHSPKPLEIIKNLMVYSDKIVLSMPNKRWNFRDGLRKEDHGHGPHIQKFGFGDMRNLFYGFGKAEIRPVRAGWLGSFGFGMFVFVEMNR